MSVLEVATQDVSATSCSHRFAYHHQYRPRHSIEAARQFLQRHAQDLLVGATAVLDDDDWRVQRPALFQQTSGSFDRFIAAHVLNQGVAIGQGGLFVVLWCIGGCEKSHAAGDAAFCQWLLHR